ncbi:hypothetical protein H8D36_04490 [archaeon]|nr:hypothetical protein [archaeon]MBL7057239.1 hypothetical protein [Candidatus Woesearchaeota archaeon]
MEELDKLREKNILAAKKKIAESVNEDDFIIHTINNIEELAKVTNVLTKRLRGWYAIYLPEFSRKVSDNEAFVNLILEKDRKALMQEMKINISMGMDLSKRDLKPIMDLASQIKSLYDLRDELKSYLEIVMSNYCKNMFSITGALLGAKLLKEAGSLKKLSRMTSSIVQLLGAENALFRHLKTGALPPKHGVIIQHPLVSSAKKSLRGKHARVLADKISIAVKTDYFKGEFIGDKLKKDIETKLR